MDETTTMVLGAIENMNRKLDDLKDTVAEYTSGNESRLATIEQWKRSCEQADIDRDARIRRLEEERATAKAMEELKVKFEKQQDEISKLKETNAATSMEELKVKFEKQQDEISKLKETNAAVSMKDKIQGAIVAIVASGGVSLLIHYFTGKS